MKRLCVLVLLAGFFACSSGGADDCLKNPAFCEDCSAPGNHCGPDGGAGDASLRALAVSAGALRPIFSPNITTYQVAVNSWVDALQVTAITSDPAAQIELNGAPISSAIPSMALPLGTSMTTLQVTVRARNQLMRSYTIVVTRAAADSHYVKASNTNAADTFGSAIALSGDTMAVGAWCEASKAAGVNGNQNDNSTTCNGAVYVFRRSGSTWMQEAYLKPSYPHANNDFGYALSLSGDTLAVGAFGESSKATGINGNANDASAPQSGAVYVFRRSGTTWMQEAYLKSSNSESGDNFGDSLALSGDTLAVGAYLESSGASGVNGNQSDNSKRQAGAAYVFLRSGSTWTQQAYIKASNPDAYDQFGWSVAVSGDTLAVGATGESSKATGVNGDQTNNGGPGSGAIYVFSRSGASWTQQAYLKPGAYVSGVASALGHSLAISGDTIVAGAYGDASSAKGINGNPQDSAANQSGAAYVFVRSGSTWTQQAYIKASNSDAQDQFGAAIALSDDTLAVGAIYESSGARGMNGTQSDNSARHAGAVYLFRRAAGAWAQKAYVKGSNSDANDQFGQGLALSQDLLIAGATGESSRATGIDGEQSDNSAMSSGAVYVYQ